MSVEETQPSSINVNDPEPDLLEQNHSTCPSIVNRLSTGNVFQTFKEFQDVLELYHQSVKVPFVMRHAKTVEAYNKTLTQESSKYPSAWKYASVQFHCKHYGTYSVSRGRGLKVCK